MAEYIDRAVALAVIQNLYPGIPLVKANLQKWHEQNRDFMACETAIERIPAADVRPVVKARWGEYEDELFGEIIKAYCCSNCHHLISRPTIVRNYCPNCGARMVKGEEDEN